MRISDWSSDVCSSDLHAARNASAQALEFGGVAQEVDQFLDVFFGFVATGDIGKGNMVGVFVEHAGARFAEAECPALAAALHLAHEKYPHANRSEEHASELQSLMRISYAVFCLKKKQNRTTPAHN